MKTFYALLSTIAFAMFSMTFAYYTKEVWTNLMSPELITTSNSEIIPIALGEYFLVSGFIVSLSAYMKKGFHNLKNIFEEGLLSGLIIGLFTGLICGLITSISIGLIDGLVGSLIAGLAIGLAIGLYSEQKKELI